MNLEEPMSDIEVTSGSVADTASQEQQFFSTPEIMQRLDLLRHLTDNSERIVVLKGGVGSGKTTLFQRYQQAARDEWVLCPVISNPMLHPEQLFSLLGHCFGVAGDCDESVDLLLERFENLQEEGRAPVIVVDDAHLLPLSTIIALLRLFERRPGERALVRIVLFALPQIDDLLQTPQIQTMNLQMLQMLELPVFSTEQTRAFIAFISGADLATGSAFDEAEVERIAKISGGVAGAIEEQVMAALRVSAAAERGSDTGGETGQSTSLRLSTPALLAGAVLGVLVILALLFQDGINRLFEGDNEPQQAYQAVPEIELKLPEPANKPPKATPMDTSPVVTAPVGDEPPPEAEPVMVELAEVMTAPVNTQEPMVELAEVVAAPVNTQKIAQEPLLEEEEAAVEGIVNVPTATVDDVDVLNGQGGGEEGAVEPRIDTTLVSQPVPVVTPPAEVQAAHDNRPEDRKENKSQPVVVVKEEPQQKPPPPTAERREAWLQVQNPGSYTLQLIGVQSEQAAYAFTARHKVEQVSAIFKTEREGKPWFSVVHGVYADRDAAVAAREVLPAGVRSGAVWPRSFASIQQAINNN
ncbi:MAG: AAA family ATPase [Candidatus Sedimenticola sp. (ex Thyasira tokunagai)]